MNIFVETDYREVLKGLVAERKKAEGEFSFQKLSEKIGVQKSYMSKVIKGTADLSPDQIFLAAEALELGLEQRQYLALLLEHERSAVKRRKDALATEIKKMQARHHHSSSEHYPGKKVRPGADGLAEYYLDPLLSIVHMALLCSKYRNNPALLAEALNLKPFRVNSAIHKLEQLGIVRREKNRLVVEESDLHLEPRSPVFASWRNGLRQLSLHYMRFHNRETTYSYTLTFPANPRVRTAALKLLMDVVEQLQKMVKDCPEEEVYQLNLDLFTWTHD